MSERPLALLFVYGTLWTHSGYRKANRLARRCLRDLGPASIAGRLYDMGRFPAAVPARDPSERIRGRLCALIDMTACLPRLDAYEECDPDHPALGLYRRECVESRLEQTRYRHSNARVCIDIPYGEPQQCWVYFFNGRLTGRPRIRHGDYRRWLAVK